MMATKKVTTVLDRHMKAVVVSAGLMQKTVKVRVGTQKWNSHIGKNFKRRTHLLVHDPRSSLRLGDIINITPGWRTSKAVHHVVTSIVAPFGEPIDTRPPVPTLEERLAERLERKKAKDERKAARQQGLEGKEVEAWLREKAEKRGEKKARWEQYIRQKARDEGFQGDVITVMGKDGTKYEVRLDVDDRPWMVGREGHAEEGQVKFNEGEAHGEMDIEDEIPAEVDHVEMEGKATPGSDGERISEEQEPKQDEQEVWDALQQRVQEEVEAEKVQEEEKGKWFRW